MDIKAFTIVSLAVALLNATGCGDGSGGIGGGSGTSNPSGIDRSGNSVGAIDAFGSVIVNGVEWETGSSTVFTVEDDDSRSQDDLAVGDIVVIKGTIDGGTGIATATSVEADDLIEGPIGMIDTTNETFVVLGTTVRTDLDTIYDDSLGGSSFAALTLNASVEVHGFIRADGSVLATRIEASAPTEEFEVTGIVANLTETTFDINDLSVDFSSADFDDFDGKPIEEGDPVEVKGSSTLGPLGELVATKVEFKGAGPFGNAADEDFEIEGLVTAIGSNSIAVGGLTIQTGGLDLSGLVINMKVEVEGNIDVDGVLQARSIEIRATTNLRVTANVDAGSIDPVAGSFEMLGITILTDQRTQLEDKSDLDTPAFGVDDLADGDYLEVRGSVASSSSTVILASRVEREDPDVRIDLRGFVQAEDGMTITVLGVTIMTGSATQYRDANDAPISADEFFAAVDIDTLVDAQGVATGATTILAEELELED